MSVLLVCISHNIIYNSVGSRIMSVLRNSILQTRVDVFLGIHRKFPKNSWVKVVLRDSATGPSTSRSPFPKLICLKTCQRSRHECQSSFLTLFKITLFSFHERKAYLSPMPNLNMEHFIRYKNHQEGKFFKAKIE